MLAITYACAIIGIEAHIVEVQVDFNPRAGIPSFNIVGLPDTAVRESRERVRAAIKNTNYTMHQRLRGSTPQEAGGSSTTPQGQRSQENGKHVSGQRFPYNKQPII